jgi:simple sugar transport system permease protein
MLINLFAMTVTMSTPFLLCVMGGLYAQRAGVFNIALEGIMNFGAFGGILFVILTSNIVLGGILGVCMSVLITIIFMFFAVKMKSNPIIVGIAINLVSLSVPPFIMQAFYHSRSSLTATDIIDPQKMKLDVPILRSIPILNEIFNFQTPLTYLSFILVVVLTIVMFKTRFGVYVRVTGENEEAAKAIGIKVDNIRYAALIISAITCGLAGLNLSVESLGMYTMNMTANRGFICLSAIVCGKRQPVRSALYALLFGLAKALQIMLTNVVDSVTASLIGMLPYLTILLVLLVTEIPATRRNTVRIFQDS